MLRNWMVCERMPTRYSTRDALVGAGVMLGSTLILALLGIAAKREGWTLTGEILTSIAFPAASTLSLPFWLLKCRSWKAQFVIVGVALALLLAITYLAAIL